MLRRDEGCSPRATGAGGLVAEKMELKRPPVLPVERAPTRRKPSAGAPESLAVDGASAPECEAGDATKHKASWQKDAQSTRQSLLQSARVRPRTRELYLRAWDQFVLFSLTEGHRILTTTDLETALLSYFDVLWMDGQHASAGRRLLSAATYLRPELGGGAREEDGESASRALVQSRTHRLGAWHAKGRGRDRGRGRGGDLKLRRCGASSKIHVGGTSASGGPSKT